MKTNHLVLTALCAVIATIFQCIPALFSEFFILMTIFSTIPIFLMGHIKPRYGLLTYLITFILVSILSPHECIMFLFTNGILGLTLGISNYYKHSLTTILLLSSCCLTFSILYVMLILNVYLIGFTFSISIYPVSIIFFFSIVYSYLMYKICLSILRRLHPIKKNKSLN